MLARIVGRAATRASGARVAAVRAFGSHAPAVAEPPREQAWYGPVIYEHENLPDEHHDAVLRPDGSINIAKTHFADPYHIYGPYGGLFAPTFAPDETMVARDLAEMCGPEGLKESYAAGLKKLENLPEDDEGLDYYKSYFGLLAGEKNEANEWITSLTYEQLADPVHGVHTFPRLGGTMSLSEEIQESSRGPNGAWFKAGLIVTVGSIAYLAGLTVYELKSYYAHIDADLEAAANPDAAHH